MHPSVNPEEISDEMKSFFSNKYLEHETQKYEKAITTVSSGTEG